MQRYYFDHNATTPLAPDVLEAMLPLMTDVYGNASSIHHFGQIARKKLDDARRQVARMLNAAPEEIVFTSGGTEADNLAIHGRRHAITTSVEHPAVLAACARLESHTVVPVDRQGVVDPDDIRRAINPETDLISVMHANNELGTVQPIAEIANIAREAGIAFHSDGVQAAGKLAVDVKALVVDFYSISAHKIYGPKGTGALYVRKGAKVSPLLAGGRHERGVRPGTENVAGAVGLARAADLVREHGFEDGSLRDRLERSILARIADSHVNGAGVERTLNTTNIRFDGIDSDALLIALDLRGFAVSSGAACSSGAPEPSHVLLAIGLSKLEARSSIRFSLGRTNNDKQIDALVGALEESVAHLRKLAPAYV